MLIPVLIFIFAFIPRLLGLGFDGFNTDAFFWKENTYNFMGLFFKGQFSDMAITHHPGVTLMWLGGIGMKVFRAIYVFLYHQTAPDTQIIVLWTDFAQKLPIALVTTLTIIISYFLVKKLLPKSKVALLLCLILATEPWLVAHSRVFNTDALMASFMWLSVLTLWLTVVEQKFFKWSILAGLFAGLAFLTKSISLFLLPFLGLSLLLALALRLVTWRKIIIIVSCYSLAAIAAFVILWPAMWQAPLDTLKIYFNGIFLEGETRLNRHNIFGNPTMNPGPIFYPLVFVFRFSPELLVLFVTGLFFWLKRRQEENPQERDKRSIFLITSALLFIIFYTLEISLAAKKLDRYLLPILPSVALLAAIGLFHLSILASRFKGLINQAPTALVVLLFMYRFVVLAIYYPDFLAYYNPLLGGPTQGYNFDGEWWGEGYHAVGSWVNERLDVRAVAAYDNRQLRPFVKDAVAVYDAGDRNLDSSKVDVWVLHYNGDGTRPGFQLVKTIYVAGYPMWGIYTKN